MNCSGCALTWAKPEPPPSPTNCPRFLRRRARLSVVDRATSGIGIVFVVGAVNGCADKNVVAAIRGRELAVFVGDLDVSRKIWFPATGRRLPLGPR